MKFISKLATTVGLTLVLPRCCDRTHSFALRALPFLV